MSFLLSLGLSTLLAGPALPVAPPAQTDSIGDLVAKSGGRFDFNPLDADILLNAVATAGLFGALDDDNADLTLFAPNDLAFILLARNLGYPGFEEEGAWQFLVSALTNLGGGNPIPVLTDVLTYHVVPQSLTAMEVFNSTSITTLQGGTIEPEFVMLKDKDPDIANPMLFFPFDVSGTNGHVHVITRVLLPVDL